MSTRCCAGSTKSRGGVLAWRAICSRASGGRLRSRASSALRHRSCSPVAMRSSAAGARAYPSPSPSPPRTATSSAPPKRRGGICHNDLAKEQNWLRGRDGRAYLTDFQLATHFSRRSWLFRIAAYEDLRHLLKHKRHYAPDALTAAERRVLAKKSLLTRVWMATGKKLYYRITRDVLHVSDREGGGTRLLYDAPRIAARLKAHPQVREAVVVAFPDRRVGTGLYAFVEGDPGLTERGLREFLAA